MMKAVSTFALASLLFFTAACRNETATTDTAATSTTETTDTATATHPASPGGTALVPDVAAGTTVMVVVTEGSVAVQGQAIPPGPAVITVQNGGKERHNLTIEGEGISVSAGDIMDAGGTRTVDVQFKPGTYTFSCPVLNHRDLGEQTTITIGTGPAGTDTAATTASGT
jgi:plastocyanin